MNTFEFIKENWMLISGVLYGIFEILARVIPTKINLSTIDKIKQLLDAIIPNMRKPDGKEVIAAEKLQSNAPTKKRGLLRNLIKVAINRHILKVVLLIILCNSANAQIWQNFRGIRLVNNIADTLGQLQVNGSVFYCEVCSPPAFYVYENNQWKTITGGGGGSGLTGASNGLSVSGTDAILGGTLTSPTAVLGSTTQPFAFIDLSTFGVSTAGNMTFAVGGDILSTADFYNFSTPSLTVGLTIDNTAGLGFNGNTFSINSDPGDPGEFFSATGGWVTPVAGTLNRISLSGTNTKTIDIAGTYVGQTSITTLGTIGTGTWNGTTIATARGGTGLTTIGSSLQVLRTNAAGTALEYATPQTVTFGAATRIPVMNAGGTDFTYFANLLYNDATLTMTTPPLFNMGTDAGTIRRIIATGSGANVGLSLESKGTGNVQFNAASGHTTITSGQVGTGAADAAYHFYSDRIVTAQGDKIIQAANGAGADIRGSYMTVAGGDGTGPTSADGGDVYIRGGAGIGAGIGGRLFLIPGTGGVSGTPGLLDCTISFAGVSTGLVQSESGLTVTTTETGVQYTQFQTIPNETSLTWSNSGNTQHSAVNASSVGIFLDTNAGHIFMTEGANQNIGVATLVGGTVTVNNTLITANSNIMLTSQVDGGTPGFVRISARSVGTSFTITSSSGTDTSTIGWVILERQ